MGLLDPNPKVIRALLLTRGVTVEDIQFNGDEQRVELYLRTRQGPLYREFTYAEIRQMILGNPPDSPHAG